MAQGPSDTILVAIRITLRIRECKVRNLDHPDWRRFVLCECILVSHLSDRILSYGGFGYAAESSGVTSILDQDYSIMWQL